eukprot:SAG31_NODE_310_length_17887_cov_4.623060_13_plen_307_part_00
MNPEKVKGFREYFANKYPENLFVQTGRVNENFVAKNSAHGTEARRKPQAPRADRRRQIRKFNAVFNEKIEQIQDTQKIRVPRYQNVFGFGAMGGNDMMRASMNEQGEKRYRTTRELRDLFKQLDVDGNKVLSPDEVTKLTFDHLGANSGGFWSKSLPSDAFAEMDPDRSGGVTEDEFIDWWRATGGGAMQPWAKKRKTIKTWFAIVPNNHLIRLIFLCLSLVIQSTIYISCLDSEEALIRTLSRRTTAVKVLTDILNDEYESPLNAQLYALCGLLVASPKQFENELRKFQVDMSLSILVLYIGLLL